MHVNVFQLGSEEHFPLLDFQLDLAQRVFDLFKLLLLNQPLFGQHASVRDRPQDIVAEQAMIKANALAERLEPLVRRN